MIARLTSRRGFSGWFARAVDNVDYIEFTFCYGTVNSVFVCKVSDVDVIYLIYFIRFFYVHLRVC